MGRSSGQCRWPSSTISLRARRRRPPSRKIISACRCNGWPVGRGQMATKIERESDPRALLAAAPMHWRQIAAIAVCVALNALDGFDVLSISFASPGIAREWGIDRGALGIVLSMELFGM